MGNACCGDDQRPGATFEDPVAAPALSLSSPEAVPDSPLRVMIVGASGLREESAGSKVQVCCTCQVEDQEASRVRTNWNYLDLGPNWYHEFEMKSWCPGAGLEFAVLATTGGGEPLGRAVLSSDQLRIGFAGRLPLLCARQAPGASLTVKATLQGDYPPMPVEAVQATALRDEYRVSVRKTAQDDKIGVDIVPQDTTLRIKRIKEGLILSWNQQHDEQVQPGDLILEANGFRGNVQDILAQIARANELDLLIQRCKS